MNSERMRARIDDLEKWSTLGLKRRMQLDLDMELALTDLGYRNGLHRTFLHWDRIIIQEILKKKDVLIT